MSCVNIKSPAYKELVKGMPRRQEYVARVLISNFMTENSDKLPTFVELKALMSDLYTTNKVGVDYKEFYGAVRQMFKTLIPSMTDADIEQRVRFVDKLELMRLRGGKKVLTSFIDDVVYISKSLVEDRGDKAFTDVRHEIFHVIFNNFLNEKEQIAMAETFKRWKPQHAGISDKTELEEAMADAFEDYRNDEKKSIPTLIKEFFQSILRFFGVIGNHYNDIKRLFADVERGKFTRNYIKDSLVTRDKTILTKYNEFFTSPDLFLQAKEFVLNNLNDLMFPTQNDKISEITNNNLFINQSVPTRLFQNNKNVFKLGLTKDEALKQLQERLTILKNTKDVDPQIARMVEILSSRKWNVLKDMYNYLQPYSEANINGTGELELKNRVGADPTESLLESDEEINSLEIGSKELINPVTKISEVVKDFLSSVTYEISDGNVANIDPGAGFIALLNLLGNLYGNGTVEDNKSSMQNAYNQTAKGNQTKAVYNRLLKLHDSVAGQNSINLNIKGVTKAELKQLTDTLDKYGIKNEVFKEQMTILIPANMKIENKGTNNVDNEVVFSFNRHGSGEKSFLITQGIDDAGKSFSETNKAFIERIAATTGVPNFVINKLFTYNEERNQLAEITKVAGSLRKLNPKFVRVATTKIAAQDTGIPSTITTYHFIDRVNELRDSISVAAMLRERLDISDVRADVIKLIDSYKDIKEKGNTVAMRALLQDILVSKLGLVSVADFGKISNNRDVAQLMNSLERMVSYTPDLRTEIEGSEFSTKEDYLRHTSNFANLLTKYTDEKNNPTSFSVSTTGKQKWENVMANAGYKLFKNLQEFALGNIRADKLLPYLKNSMNNYLRFNPIFKHNLTTGEVVVNEGMIKYKDNDYHPDPQETYFDNKLSSFVKPAIPFSKESPRDWINRNFLAMFQVPILEGTQTGSMSYFQQKFQPESAPNVSGIKMGVQNADQIETNIMHMILQEGYMQHYFSNSNRKALKKNSGKSYLPGLEGRAYFMVGGVNVMFDANGKLNDGSAEMNDAIFGKEVNKGKARPEYNFGSVVNGQIQVNKRNELLRELHGEIMKNLDNSMDKFVEMAITEKATLDGIQISELYSKIHSSYAERYKISLEEMPILRGININGKTNLEEFMSNPNYEIQKKVLKKALSAYYLNSFTNGFFMNQISSGATQNYKTPLDEIKRQAGVNAMHDTGLIDPKHGMKNSYKNVVIASANNFYGASHEFAEIPLLQRFFRNKKQEVGDAQTWDLPEYKQMLRKSFGKSVDMGVITKDVHFENNNEGGVDYRKTSSAELTNELVRKNKTLRDLRYGLTFGLYLNSLEGQEKQDKQARIDYLYNKMIDGANKNNKFDGLRDNVDEYMEYQSILNDIMDKDMLIHKASFESAIKGSKPTNMSSFTKNDAGTFDFNLHPESILTLNSAYTGIQQAIRHRYIDSFISHFTQLTYLIGLNRTETSIKNNKIITKTLSKFTKAGIYDTLFDYRMAYDTIDKLLKVNNKSKAEVIKDLKKKLDLPGNEAIMALLDTPGISMNNPIFSEKLMQTLFNTLTKKTVVPKHPGGSFVLQSEFGFESSKILKDNSLKTPTLVRENGKILYAECYLPEMYSDQIKSGSMMYYNSDEYNKMFGFRIPSSDLHSSVPLKVIGYYPSSSHDNVIVIPSAVTALHGSDFDVDKLFVVRYGVFGIKDEDNGTDPQTGLASENEQPTIKTREYKTKFQTNNTVLAQKGIKFGFTAPNAEYDKNGNIKSFGDGDVHNEIKDLEETLMSEKEKTQAEIIKIETAQAERNAKRGTTVAEIRKAKRLDNEDKAKIASLNEHLKVVKSIQKGYFSNTILSAVLDNISYSGENAPDIMQGITFDPVKGYEESSEYSQLARVFSDINKSQGSKDLLAERPTLYTSVQEAENSVPEKVAKIKEELTQNLGVDINTPQGQEDLLSLINEDLKDDWVSERDAFIGRVRGSGTVNINKVEDHVTVHKETYMAAGLVGLIANFSKGLAYAFHGIMDKSSAIELDLNEEEQIVIDGQTFNTLSLENKDNIKTQELRSLALNAAIDHVKEQILNVLNVGNKTAKIFLAAISTNMNLHQSTMLMLQPVAKELNSSNATTVADTLKQMMKAIIDKLADSKQNLSEQEIKDLKVNTADLEKFIRLSFSEVINDTSNPDYRKNLLLQYKVIKQLGTLEMIGQEVSNVSSALSIIQNLPYNLELAYDKLKAMNNFINIEKFFDKLTYTEKSEYATDEAKADLKGNKNILKNVNLANNENVLAALEAIKTQVDMACELFTENSLQAQHLIYGMIKAISDNSDPTTLFSGPNDIQITPDTTKNMTVAEKYLRGKNSFNLFKLMSRNIFNFLSSGMNMTYNKGQHLMGMSVRDQELLTVTTKKGTEFTLNAVRSYINSFLMKEGDAFVTIKEGRKTIKLYNGDDYVVSQINPEWRIKPLSVIKRENAENKFLRGLGVDVNFKENVRIMTFNTNMVNNSENLAEVERSVGELNSLNNIYVKFNEKTGNWENVPSEEHPFTEEMNEIVFNIIKSSLYLDKFKFGTTKVTSIIPPLYYVGLFKSADTLTRDLIYFQKNEAGAKYFKSFADLNDKSKKTSVIGDIKENLFINTIFSIPHILPNLKSVLPSSKDRRHRIKQAGILPNGNIYDLYFDAKILDTAKIEEEPKQAETTIDMTEGVTEPNSEFTEEISEVEAESDLYETLRKNPSFIADEQFDKPGNYEIFMKVGTTGSKETNDQKYYYKRIGFVSGKLTNNSFDTNQLLNKYKIGEHFNPKRLSIPVAGVDLSQSTITLNAVPISSFLINASDDDRTRNDNNPAVKEAFNQQFELLRALPENKAKSDDTIRSEIRTKINVENVINKINEVSLYDSRSLDRVGIKNFKVRSRSISADRRTASFVLEVMPSQSQVSQNKFETPLVMLSTLSQALTRQEKIDKINSTPGIDSVIDEANLTDAEIDLEYKRALELDESREVIQVLNNKNC